MLLQTGNLVSKTQMRFDSFSYQIPSDSFSKCDQIRCFLRIWSHLLKKSSMENLIFRALSLKQYDTKGTKNCNSKTDKLHLSEGVSYVDLCSYLKSLAVTCSNLQTLPAFKVALIIGSKCLQGGLQLLLVNVCYLQSLLTTCSHLL